MREMGEAELAEVGTGDYGSDNNGIASGVDDLATNGAYAAVSASRRNRQDLAKMIPDEDYRQAYLDVFELKKKEKVRYDTEANCCNLYLVCCFCSV